MKSITKHPTQLAVLALLALLLAALALPGTALADSSTPTPVSQIKLTTAPGAWTVVQWQDSRGGWNDVSNWRAQATDGTVSWSVEQKDFGTGPFRWVSYSADGRTCLGISGSFYLPQAWQTVSMTIQGGYFPPYPPPRPPQPPQPPPPPQPPYQPPCQPIYPSPCQPVYPSPCQPVYPSPCQPAPRPYQPPFPLPMERQPYYQQPYYQQPPQYYQPYGQPHGYYQQPRYPNYGYQQPYPGYAPNCYGYGGCR